MSQKEPFDRAVEDDHLDVSVRFRARNDLVQLRNGRRTEDVERRMIDRYPPIAG